MEPIFLQNIYETDKNKNRKGTKNTFTVFENKNFGVTKTIGYQLKD